MARSPFNETSSVTGVVNQATRAGWSATASSIATIDTARQWYLFVGNATPVGAATIEGLVACD